MKRKATQDPKEVLFTSRQEGTTAFLNLSENLLLRATDLDRIDRLLDYLDRVEADDSVRTLIVAGSPEKTGEKEYYDFYYRLCRLKFDRNAIYRMYNAVDQFIMKITTLPKLVVHVDSGRLIPLYLNASLACDYRIVSENAVFENAYIDLGLAPKGGGAFFLTKLLGKSKAFQFLLSDRRVTASEALALGLVDEIVASDQLEKAALDAAARFEKIPERTLAAIKSLMAFDNEELARYLESENRELMKIIDSPAFRKDLGHCPEEE